METQKQTDTQTQTLSQTPVRSSSLEHYRRTSLAKRGLSEKALLLPLVEEEEVVTPPCVTPNAATSPTASAPPAEKHEETRPTRPTLIAPLPPSPSLHPSNRKKGVLNTLRQKASSVSVESLLGVPNKRGRGKASHLPAKTPPKASKVLGLAIAEGKEDGGQDVRLSGSRRSLAFEGGWMQNEEVDVGEGALEKVMGCRNLVRETVVLVDGRIGEWERQRDEILGILKGLQDAHPAKTDVHNGNTRFTEVVNPYNVRITVRESDNDTEKSSEGSAERDMVPRSEIHDVEDLLLASDAENGKLETAKRALEKEIKYLRAEIQGLKVQDERFAITNKGLEAQNMRLNTENVRLKGQREGLEKRRERLEDVVVEIYKFVAARPHPQPRTSTTPLPPPAQWRSSSSDNQAAISTIYSSSSGGQRISTGSVQRSTGEEMGLEEMYSMHIRTVIEEVDKELLNRCMGAKTAEFAGKSSGNGVKGLLK